MSISNFFLSKELQTPSTLATFSLLLGSTLSKLSSEYEMLAAEESTLVQQTAAQSSNQAIEFSRSLKDYATLKTKVEEASEASEQLRELAEDAKEIIEKKSNFLEKNLQHQNSLKSIEKSSRMIGEVLDMPMLLKTLVNTQRYGDAIEVIECSNRMNSVQGKVIEGVLRDIDTLKGRLKRELVEKLGESAEVQKDRELLGQLRQLNAHRGRLQVLYLATKTAFIEKKIEKHAFPLQSILSCLGCMRKYLFAVYSSYIELFCETDMELSLFLCRAAGTVMTVLHRNAQKLQELTEIRVVLDALLDLDSGVLVKLGCSIATDCFPKLIVIAKSRISEISRKTYSHFENMIKLYQWEMSGNKENPLLQFGSIAVLYSNIVGLVNSVRELPLEDMKELLYEEVTELLVKTTEFSFNKGAHLLAIENLTRQQSIYQGLFIKYQECLRDTLVPSVKQEILSTSEYSDEKLAFFTTLQSKINTNLLN